MERSNNQRLDEYLDSALAEYGRVEPRPGIETRIMARLRAERQRDAPIPLWKWLLPAACSAIAILVLLAVTFRPGKVHEPVVLTHVSHTPQQPVRTSHEHVPKLEANARRSRFPHLAPHAHKAEVTGSSTAVTSQFPSPHPMTEQQKLLLVYLEHTPKDELVTVARKENDNSDLTIEDLRIPPLAPQLSWPNSEDTN